MVSEATKLIKVENIRSSFQHCGFHLVDNSCFNYFTGRLNTILRGYIIWDKEDEDWDKNDENMTQLNSDTFEQPYLEKAVCPCPHYLDSIEAAIEEAIQVDPAAIDYNVEVTSDKHKRWDQTLNSVIYGDNFEDVVNEQIALDDHFNVFDFF